MNNVKPTWYILGAGAIGCLWAAYLRYAGFPVVLISRNRNDHTQLLLNNNNGNHQLDLTYRSIDQLTGTINYLLVTTKAQQTTEAISAIRDYLEKNATVLIVQNGIATEQLPQVLPTQKLFAAVTTDGAYKPDNNTVVHAGKGKTIVGTLTPGLAFSECESLIEQLPAHYLCIESATNFLQHQWKKLAINCVINGLTAIYQCRNGELLTINEAKKTAMMLCNETFTVIKASGIHIANDANTLFQDVVSACRTTAKNYSSTYQDIKNKRPTEIDYINGFICRQAQKLSLHCPENQSIVDKIKQLEQTE